MKYMGWSWADLMTTPASVIYEVAQVMIEEAERDKDSDESDGDYEVEPD